MSTDPPAPPDQPPDQPPADQPLAGWGDRYGPPPPSSDIVIYLEANTGRYTKEALDQRLLAAGHPPEAIAAAWSTVESADRAAGRQDRRGQTAGIIAVVYIATWALVTFGVIAPNNALYASKPILAGILAVALFIPGIIAVAIAQSAGWLRRAGVGRVVAFVFVPFLILFALAGTCVSYVQAY
jgi:hypothetical protein